MVDWGGGVCCSCSIALPHHWLLPINCHFLRLYSAAGRGIAGVSSAIEESDLYFFTFFMHLKHLADGFSVLIVVSERHNCTILLTGFTPLAVDSVFLVLLFFRP